MTRTPASFPLLPAFRQDDTTAFRQDDIIAWWRGGAVGFPQLSGAMQWLAERLPEAPHAFNLCENRFLFMVGFGAVIARGQTNLLPANRLAREIEQVAADYPGSYCLVDKEIPGLGLPQVICALPDPLPDPRPSTTGARPEIPAGQIAAIPFTSGSTGRPQPNPKCWGSLVKGAQLAKARFWAREDATLTLVATVPPQHMYGLETTILLPMVTGIEIHGGRPFFPRDIHHALAGLPSPVALVTTPVHLRACLEAGLDWPRAAFVLSATAPLSPQLAAAAEAAFGGPVLEIYGCTEGGSLASRRTVETELWTLYDGLTLHTGTPSLPGEAAGAPAPTERAPSPGDGPGEVWVSGGHLSTNVLFPDIIEKVDGSTFRLLGRGSDMVNIAGKRASLVDLNLKLKGIEGVRDGVFVMPDAAGDGPERLTALVVAPGMSEKQVTAALVRRLDAAFLPRPLLLVEALPYNETGKLPRRELLAWIEHRKTNP